MELDKNQYTFIGEKENEISYLDKSTGNVISLMGANSDYEAKQRRATGNNNLSQGQNLSLLTGYNASHISANNNLWQRWGADNRFINNIIDLTSRNAIALGIINSMTDFVCGQKLVLYTERVFRTYENKTEIVIEYVEDNEISDGLEELEFEEKFRHWAWDCLLSGNYGVEFQRKNNGKIAGMWHTDVSTMRAGKAKKGIVEEYILADWNFTSALFDPVYLPAYNRNDKSSSRFFYHGKNYFTGSYYYGIPTWIGSENFLRLLNEIPIFHLSGIRNGFGLRWHIKIPMNYFDAYTTQKEKDDAFSKLKTEMNTWLAGAENNGKTLITKYDMNAMGVAREKGVVIEALKPELLDAAYKNLFDQANLAVTSAFGLNPELAGVIIQGSMSGNSGSGIRNAYNLFENTKAANYRKLFLQPYKILQRENGWNSKIKLGIISHNLEKLDENPAAQSQILNGQKA